MIDLGTLGGATSSAFGINDRGQIVEQSDMASVGPRSNWHHAFLWQDGKMTDLGALEPDSDTTAIAIDGSGWVVGQRDTASGAYAILWRDGTMSDPGTLGGRAGAGAAAVNDRGRIVGYSQTAAWRGHAVLWDAGGMTDLGGGGAPTTGIVATGIHERGEVVGTFLSQDGTITRLGTLGGDYSRATAINEEVPVVGRPGTPSARSTPSFGRTAG
jgi:probable HAF family extracellular repeat protein